MLRPIISLIPAPPPPRKHPSSHNQSINQPNKTPQKQKFSISVALAAMDLASGSGSHDPGEAPGPSPPGGALESAAGRSSAQAASSTQPLSRYESQKRRDWNTFLQYLKNHKPPLTLARCSGAHVIEFLKYLDQFGKTKVHVTGCPYFGYPTPPAPCACPLKQAWGSLDALIGRLRAAYEENGGQPESNPFGARAVRIYLREVKDSQAKARGIPYEKKKRKRPGGSTSSTTGTAPNVSVAGGDGDGGTSGIISGSDPVPATSTL